MSHPPPDSCGLPSLICNYIKSGVERLPLLESAAATALSI